MDGERGGGAGECWEILPSATLCFRIPRLPPAFSRLTWRKYAHEHQQDLKSPERRHVAHLFVHS